MVTSQAVAASGVEHWTLLAKCRGSEDALFCEGAEQKRARQFCDGCPVRADCLAEALDNRIEWGIWGGMTERERRSLLRRHSRVTSWKSVLLEQDSQPR
ncbi:WhiB family transcriptional regulator [Propionibacteriaceae bacterium Y2011]|uniref:WhiB family transcriptional regulator n=1 Tax=Microlunatus sp. Y2014 TaxID=3418488 RepID=UPI003B43D769